MVVPRCTLVSERIDAQPSCQQEVQADQHDRHDRERGGQRQVPAVPCCWYTIMPMKYPARRPRSDDVVAEGKREGED